MLMPNKSRQRLATRGACSILERSLISSSRACLISVCICLVAAAHVPSEGCPEGVQGSSTQSLYLENQEATCETEAMVNLQTATFAAGCFWGVENYFLKQFKTAIKSSAVGYTGGQMDNPSYERVCGGRTGHAEAFQFDFDPSEASYKDLVTFLFRIHDPTTKNRQGTQYRSAIFYHSEEQKQTAQEVIKEMEKTHWKRGITTEVVPAGQWWDAEEYHQKYLIKQPGGYCNHGLKW